MAGKKIIIKSLVTTLVTIIGQELFLNLSFLEKIFLLIGALLLINFKSFFNKFKGYFSKKSFIFFNYLSLFLITVLFFTASISKKLGYSLNISIGKTKGLSTSNLEPQPTPDNKQPSPADEIISKCFSENSTFCSDFSNIEKDFDDLEFFSTDPENPRILKSNVPKSGSKDNPVLWINNLSFTPEFHFDLTSKLYDKEKGNLTLAYGNDWRCIIGENNFNRITCEAFYSNTSKKERKSQHLSSKKFLPIQTETELLIRGSTTVINDDKLKITLTLEYFDIENNKQTATFDFETKYLSTSPQENKRRFGVGIIDPLDEGISIEFIKLEIKGGL